MLDFGKSSKGKVVHVVVLQKTALCDKRQTGLVVDKSLGPKDVTCAKCQRYAGFKAVLADRIAEDALDAAKKDKKVREALKKVKKAKDVAKKVVPAKKLTIDFCKEKKTDGTFQIIHGPSGLHFFDKIEEDVVGRALRQLNRIEVKWESGIGKPPKDFISQCRKALRIAYKQAGIEIPDGLIKQNDPVEEVKKEKITKKKDKKKIRKEKKSRKIIKRRDKKPAKETKPKKKSKRQVHYDFIVEQMTGGISISELITLLVKEFGLSAKKANSKVKGNIRRMRRKGIEIVIRLTEKKEDDFYKIVK